MSTKAVEAHQWWSMAAKSNQGTVKFDQRWPDLDGRGPVAPFLKKKKWFVTKFRLKSAGPRAIGSSRWTAGSGHPWSDLAGTAAGPPPTRLEEGVRVFCLFIFVKKINLGNLYNPTTRIKLNFRQKVARCTFIYMENGTCNSMAVAEIL